jgi:hypothetical protein
MIGDRVNNGRFALAFLTSFSPLALAGALVPTALTSPALAGDVSPVQPYYAVVGADKATAFSGPSDRFYRVGEVNPGQIVLVDGEGNAWSRISYPSNLFAYVRVEEVKVDGGFATLTTQSKLKAANPSGGFTNSWKALMDSPLSVGERFKVIEPAKEGDVVVGYKITPPDSARCYVESRALRHATDAEVETFKSKGSVPSIPTPPATTPKPDGGTAKPFTPVTPGPTTSPDASKPTTGPIVINPQDTKPAPAPAKPEDRAVGKIEQLVETFNTVWKQPVLTSEVGELKAEFERAAEKAKDNPDLQKQLQKRVDALQARIDFRETVRKQADARAALDKKKNQLDEEVSNWEKSRVYTVVGELQPSTVYDGQHLPQMFRVVSVGGSPRTLGYLKPSKDVDLTAMMGQVVGVIGDSTLDRSLKLNIIDPIKVVTLKEAQPTKAPAKDEQQAGVEEKGDEAPKKSSGY